MSDPWPHQLFGAREVLLAHRRGERRVCLTSPTGGGKTRIAEMLIDEWLTQGKKVVIYGNRRLLLEQLHTVFRKAGLLHGVRAPGYDADSELPIQICTFQTEHSRVGRRQAWDDLYKADIVLVDEAHLQTGPTVEAILQAHGDDGAFILGMTATPVGIGHLYDVLIQAGTTSELRQCGALVRARHFGPDEPDLQSMKLELGVDLSEKQAVAAVMRRGLFGRVLDNYLELNPTNRPTILFAPSVETSIWFAERFAIPAMRHPKHQQLPAIPAAHIDSRWVWWNGRREVRRRGPTDQAKTILKESERGNLPLVTNRFVLREGVDAPWIAHGIFATIFGGLSTYLQAGGRFLRAHSSLDEVTIQDHGGNWWRHGSLNSDRVWDLRMTDRIAAGLRKRAMQQGNTREPWRCPKCKEIMNGTRCGSCKFQWDGPKSRPVVMQDGTLKELGGGIFKKRRIDLRSDTENLWERMYFRAKNSGMTFNQALGLFVHEHYYEPPRTIRLMPLHEMDWFVPVKDVRPELLTG